MSSKRLFPQPQKSFGKKKKRKNKSLSHFPRSLKTNGRSFIINIIIFFCVESNSFLVCMHLRNREEKERERKGKGKRGRDLQLTYEGDGGPMWCPPNMTKWKSSSLLRWLALLQPFVQSMWPTSHSVSLSLSLHWLGLILFLFMREVQKSKTPFLEFWWKSLSLQLPNYYSLFSSFWQSDVVVLLVLLLVALVSLPIMDKPHCGNLYDLHKIAKIVNFFFTKKLLPILFLLNAYKVNSFIINIICPKLYNSSI